MKLEIPVLRVMQVGEAAVHQGSRTKFNVSAARS